ncbi:hypothetical protein N9K81_02550, partial [Candidatus Poseidoniales archaeon]|nr:hypothetical protein [Candidatus Poseidoniales archaeon]
QASLSFNGAGFHPVFQKSRSSNHCIHSSSEQLNSRNARASNPSLLAAVKMPCSRHAIQPACGESFAALPLAVRNSFHIDLSVQKSKFVHP